MVRLPFCCPQTQAEMDSAVPLDSLGVSVPLGSLVAWRQLRQARAVPLLKLQM